MRETVSSADHKYSELSLYRLQRFLRGLLLLLSNRCLPNEHDAFMAQEKTGPERIVDVGGFLSALLS